MQLDRETGWGVPPPPPPTRLGEAIERISVLRNAAVANVESLETLLNLIPVPILLATDRECRNVRANTALSRALGMPIDVNALMTTPESERPRCQILRDGQELPREESPMQRAARQGVEVHNERCDMVMPDGRVINTLISATPLFDESGEPTGCIGSLVDITSQVETDREGQKALAALDALVAAAPVGIALLDADLRYRIVNGPLAEIDGLPANEHLGKTPAEVVPDAFSVIEPLLRDVLKSGVPVLNKEMRCGKPDASGQGRWLLTNWFPVAGVDGQAILVGVIVEDITRRKQAEGAVAEANQRKDEFLALLGHELRNPLASVTSSVEVLKLLQTPGSDARELLEIIERQADYMRRMINDLLDVSRIARGKIVFEKERLNLTEIVRQAVEDLRHEAEAKQCSLKTRLPNRPLWFVGDRTRIAQVLSNLLINACKFTDAGGKVTVRLDSERNGREARIVVQDTGIGMTPETLRNIFSPLQQAETSVARSRGGLGLGLALVKGLVHAHGGEVTARSAGVGKGSEFIVRLPLERGPVQEPEAVRSVASAAATYRVLAIDDRRDALRPLEKLLSLEGHKVATAQDAQTGLEVARSFHPDVVLCDIGLPGGMNGYDLAAAIRADPELHSVYLVAITGYGQESDRWRAQSAGFDYHLTKPVSKAELERLLRSFPKFEGARPE
jgi:PAS domain S-box-containing protein